MIILITGASHTGKTVLAQRMLEKYKYPYLSIDHLKMGSIRSGNTDLTPEDDDDLTQYLWPIVREMIKTAIENKQNLIVEGCYVPFYWRQDFDEQYIRSIQFICLAMSDEYIDTHFDSGTLDELAQLTGYSTAYLSRLLKQNTGLNFKQLLQQRRLQEAAYLLESTTLTTEKIIKKIGYENSAYFYRIFEAKYGISPKKYRESF